MSIVVILAYAGAACGGAVALIAILRGWRTLAGWLFIAGMLLLGLESALLGVATDTPMRQESLRWHLWQLETTSFLPAVWLMFSLTYARGNYREFLRAWRWTIGLSWLLPLVVPLSPTEALLDPVSMNPDSQWIFRLGSAAFVIYLAFLLGMLIVLMNLERTIRAAVGTMRWRVKFTVMGLGTCFVVRCYTSSQALLWPAGGVDPAVSSVGAGALVVGSLLVVRSLFRDISGVAVFPGRSLLGNSFVAIAAAVYLISVGVFAKVAALLNSAESLQFKAFFLLLVVVALTLLALSDRVRLHSRRLLSRYFQRPFYDYRQVWRTLTEGVASRVRQEDICQAAVTQVSDIFHVLSVTVWLVNEKREGLVFAASSSLAEASARAVAPSREESQAIMAALRDRTDPVDFEEIKEEWAVALRRCNPSRFRIGGSRVCSPLSAGGQLRGVIVLADRVGGVSFSLQDQDLLRCVADQVAAGLLNAQLSQKLVQAKELEAFQTMSAFFVHDLKNTASTLNLMLQNLPTHFDNPAFREDALRGVAKTCDHINNLIGRLGELRHDLQIKPVDADLNDVVNRVLSDWKGVAEVDVVKNLQTCPRLMLDPNQFLKVVTNLVINAREAMPRGGQLRVETFPRNGWAVLSVADNGCGMSEEFLSRALFRPFQTTKKKGFGIGMFQSKMIVEAHGGRFEVESEVNKGTTFRVLLPVNKQ